MTTLKKTPTAPRKILRRQICVDRKFQFLLAANMLLIALAAMLATALFTSWFYIYFLNNRLWADISTGFQYKVLVLFSLTLCGILVWTVLRSHAIAGPVYKIRKILQAAAQGEFPDHPVRFRKGDAFKDLADDVNRCLAIMQRQHTEQTGQNPENHTP